MPSLTSRFATALRVIMLLAALALVAARRPIPAQLSAEIVPPSSDFFDPASVALESFGPAAQPSSASSSSHIADPDRTEWLVRAQRGLFTHYLYTLQNNPDAPNSLGKNTSWEECVREFDVDVYAKAVAATGSRYAVFTLMQGTRFMIAPNSVYAKYTGYPTGEACSSRDLVEDLYNALTRVNVSLMLYWTGDGPHLDAQASQGLGWTASTPEVFAQRWGEVLQEYAVRYGDKVRGWWVDGCYQSVYNYTDAKLQYYGNAIRAGNPNAFMCFNDGVKHPIRRTNSVEDYTCGESNDFTEVPTGRFVQDQDQWHELSFLGTNWAKNGTSITGAYLHDYLHNITQHQGALTIDVQLFRNGSINAAQAIVLTQGYNQ